MSWPFDWPEKPPEGNPPYSSWCCDAGRQFARCRHLKRTKEERAKEFACYHRDGHGTGQPGSCGHGHDFALAHELDRVESREVLRLPKVDHNRRIRADRRFLYRRLTGTVTMKSSVLRNDDALVEVMGKVVAEVHRQTDVKIAALEARIGWLEIAMAKKGAADDDASRSKDGIGPEST